ncbi:hypothetical protein SARI_03985 [Salmonella enterica subsp. arizonae serovar 62:z4,z23:-]|uniref:Uncharacterized protein n=1 Tax=Salmonella arizonae (strain ATCC BAA-731 / CDC346-86 / RSK2980) TaxID=41514 RepID=A9MLG0_SALAR|nr:hypothetical protein SARI_03985 [Salmonella enterica subsp. arizonae serovar 62:z4,z23:-]
MPPLTFAFWEIDLFFSTFFPPQINDRIARSTPRYVAQSVPMWLFNHSSIPTLLFYLKKINVLLAFAIEFSKNTKYLKAFWNLNFYIKLFNDQE